MYCFQLRICLNTYNIALEIHYKVTSSQPFGTYMIIFEWNKDFSYISHFQQTAVIQLTRPLYQLVIYQTTKKLWSVFNEDFFAPKCPSGLETSFHLLCPAGCVRDEVRQDARRARGAVVPERSVGHGGGEQEHGQQREQCGLLQLKLGLGGRTGHQIGRAAGTGEWQKGGCHHWGPRSKPRVERQAEATPTRPSHSPPI